MKTILESLKKIFGKFILFTLSGDASIISGFQTTETETKWKVLKQESNSIPDGIGDKSNGGIYKWLPSVHIYAFLFFFNQF